jgi:hypothetical protein
MDWKARGFGCRLIFHSAHYVYYKKDSRMTNDDITKLALSNGFKLKEQPDGKQALNPYVFDFAKALIAVNRTQRQAGQEPVAWMRVKPSAMPDWDEYDFSANEQEGFDVALYAAPQPAQADKDAEIAALRKDAERYRWLMNNCGFGMNRNGVHELTTVFYENQPDNIGDLDAAIDAALQAQAVQP